MSLGASEFKAGQLWHVDNSSVRDADVVWLVLYPMDGRSVDYERLFMCHWWQGRANGRYPLSIESLQRISHVTTRLDDGA